MRTLRFVVVICCLLPSLAGAAGPTTRETTAARSLTLLSSPQVPNIHPVVKVVRERVQALAPEFRVSAELLNSYIDLTQANSGENRIVWISVRPPVSANIDSSRLLNALLEGIAPAIEAEYQATFERQSREFEDRRTSATTRQAAAKERAEKLEQEISGLTRTPQNDADSIQSTAMATAEKLQEMELEELGKGQRKKAIVEQIAERSATIEQEADNDLIVAELRKVVEAREASLENIKQQKEQGLTPAREVTEAIAALADARAKLLERRRQAAIDAGAVALQELNRELMTLSIDLREIRARREFLDHRLHRLRLASARIDEQRRCWSEASIAGTVLSMPSPAFPQRLTVILNDE